MNGRSHGLGACGYGHESSLQRSRARQARGRQRAVGFDLPFRICLGFRASDFGFSGDKASACFTWRAAGRETGEVNHRVTEARRAGYRVPRNGDTTRSSRHCADCLHGVGVESEHPFSPLRSRTRTENSKNPLATARLPGEPEGGLHILTPPPSTVREFVSANCAPWRPVAICGHEFTQFPTPCLRASVSPWFLPLPFVPFVFFVVPSASDVPTLPSSNLSRISSFGFRIFRRQTFRGCFIQSINASATSRPMRE